MDEIKQDYKLNSLAELLDLRGCCKKDHCIHRKAKYAVDRIAFLEGEVKKLKEIIRQNSLPFDTKGE